MPDYCRVNFAKRLYRINLFTIGDYYLARYGQTVELIMALCIMISYLGWVSAQVTALGLVFNLVSGGAIAKSTGMMIGTLIVLMYMLFGGMWSVALLDFVQVTVIMSALLLIAVLVSGEAGGGRMLSLMPLLPQIGIFPAGWL